MIQDVDPGVTCHPSRRETESRQEGSPRTEGSLVPAGQSDDDERKSNVNLITKIGVEN